MNAIFEASPEGFRQNQMGREAAHLVRELVQNVLDEAATFCKVTISATPVRGLKIIVEDDVPGGIRDEKLVFTIWLSDKQDSPTKRGRMGRGLKELVSVSDKTIVRTEGRDACVFTRSDAGEWSRTMTSREERPARGTVIEAQVKAWGKKDAEKIVAYLKHIRPPEGMLFTVNGDAVVRRTATESYDLDLPSVVFETYEGERRESNRKFTARVDLFTEEQSWVYEMGIPIEPTDFPTSIDVGQRVPLREKRDTLLANYKSELFAKIVDKRIAHMPKEQLRDNFVLEAAKDSYHMSESTKLLIAEAWTEGRPFANTPKAMSIATGQHVEVVNLRSLPESVRYIVEEHGQNVQEVLDARKGELCPTVEELTGTERRFIATWTTIAAGIHRDATVVICDGHPGAIASFDQSHAVLSVYRKEIHDWPAWVAFPLKAPQLGVLIHELAHWRRLEESHGMEFHSDAEDVGGSVANFLLENAERLLGMAGQGG